MAMPGGCWDVRPLGPGTKQEPWAPQYTLSSLAASHRSGCQGSRANAGSCHLGLLRALTHDRSHRL